MEGEGGILPDLFLLLLLLFHLVLPSFFHLSASFLAPERKT